MAIQFIDLAQLHVIVDDIDEAAAFYRDVLGMLEMQSHHNIVNAGLAAYYGHEGDPEDFRVSLRFMFIPDVLTIKLIKIESGSYSGASAASGYRSASSGSKLNGGLAAISVVVDDLNEAYAELLSKAQNYSDGRDVRLLSAPTFMSPLQPHEIGATEHSELYERGDILEEYAKTWPFRAKFQMLDPYGVRWEFNNDVDGLED